MLEFVLTALQTPAQRFRLFNDFRLACKIPIFRYAHWKIKWL